MLILILYSYYKYESEYVYFLLVHTLTAQPISMKRWRNIVRGIDIKGCKVHFEFRRNAQFWHRGRKPVKIRVKENYEVFLICDFHLKLKVFES